MPLKSQWDWQKDKCRLQPPAGIKDSEELKMFSLDSAQTQCPCEAASLPSSQHPACLSNIPCDSRVTCQALAHPFAGQEVSSVAGSLFNTQANQELPVVLAGKEDFETWLKYHRQLVVVQAAIATSPVTDL